MRVKLESVTLIFLLLLAPAVIAQTTPAALQRPPPDTSSETGLTPNQIVDRFIEREKILVQRIKGFRPMVETYIQNLNLDD